MVAAYKLPKASADEQAARKAAIQQALRAATEVPLGVVRLSAAALEQARRDRRRTATAPRRATSASASRCSAPALRGARLNVEINIGSITDAGYASAVDRGNRAIVGGGGARGGRSRRATR